MIKISGEYGEGGGSIIRIALALSILTNKSFEVSNIRRGRCKGGLKAQHLCAVRGAQQLSDAKIEGSKIGSEYIKFEPTKLRGQTLSLDIGTAGSITLALQSLLLPAMFADKKTIIKLTGATDGKFAQPYDYFREVYIPQIRKFCENIKVKLLKRGYYPKGNGKVEITINPKTDKENVAGIDLTEQGHLIQIKGISHASKDLERVEVAERQQISAEMRLKKLNCPIEITKEYSDTSSTGSGITLWAIFSKDPEEIDMVNPIRIGSDSLGERGKKAEIVGKEAAERLINEINYKAPVDEYLADNLIPWLALFKGRIKVAKISNHTLTNIYVVEKFMGKTFEVDNKNKIIKTLNQ